ncbi:T9SS type A sorting domain-containing protein [Flavobacterium stagni]|uniref:T9SS type A sorting domain-containing protein n=1 Tax=Flavobacterium stagni TaxID=2506421 RepID=A0A4V1N222_9FLAO|nr:T9SS type A sorting domain-containing protein [Flavobacterium stagni]RXR20211.1 T9SS type A sorting domain-containing protein [Flavobacterium stagni]
MKSFYLFLCLSLYAITSGQVLGPSWVSYLPGTTGNPNLMGTLSTVDSSGYSYVCGNTGTLSYYNVAQSNLTLKKFNSLLQNEYAVNLLGDLHVYALVSDGNSLYIALNYITQLDYETLHLSDTSGEHPVLLKLDSDGHYVWHLPLSGNNVFRFRALTLDVYNSVYIGYDNYFNSYIKKLDTNGNTLFTITQNNVKMISNISVVPQGNIAVAGGCSQSIPNFNGTSASNSLSYSTYIAYYNASQQLQWVHFFEDITCSDPDVAIDPSGNVYFTSTLYDNFPLLGQPTEGPVAGLDFFLIKLNPQGNLVWYREVPGAGQFKLAKSKSVAVSWGQNYPAVIYVAGTTRNSVQWLPDFATNPGNQDDILLLAYDLNGNLIHHTIGGSSTGNDQLDGLTINSNSSFATISGITLGTGSMHGMPLNPSTTNYTPYIIRLDQVFLNQHEFTTTTWSVSPNPAHETITLRTQDYFGKGTLTNVLGQKMRDFDIESPETVLHVNELPKGIYIITVGTTSKRISIN